MIHTSLKRFLLTAAVLTTIVVLTAGTATAGLSQPICEAASSLGVNAC